MSKILPLTGKGAPAPQAPALNSIAEILAELRAGRMVVIMDDEDRENEGDLIMAAGRVTPAGVAFMIRHPSGIICVPMEEQHLARLELPQMVPVNDEQQRTAFAVSVDARAGTTTGVSSADRAATIRALAAEASVAGDFARPGHIFPLRSRRGGVLVRAGHTEAAIDLCRLAGLKPVGVLCEVMNEDGSMARRPQLEEFARRHQLKIGTIADLIRHRLRTERSVERICEHSVQSELGEFRLYAYRDRASLEVHVALARGRGAAHLRRRGADPQGPRRAAHAGAVGAETDARPVRLRPGGRGLRRGRGVTAAQLIEGEVTARGRKIAIVAARFNDVIVTSLLKGATGAWLERGGAAADLQVVRVPGAFELPVVARKLAGSGRYDALVALGCVIRGDTPHFDYVAGECARGLQLASLETGVPIAFGVLTVDRKSTRLNSSHGYISY